MYISQYILEGGSERLAKLPHIPNGSGYTIQMSASSIPQNRVMFSTGIVIFPRTNNIMRGFYGAVQRAVTNMHPSIWKLVAALVKKES